MIRLLSIAFLTAASFGSPAFPDTALDRAVSGSMKDTLVQFIRPAYHELKLSTDQLNDAMVSLCNTPSQPNLDASQTAFRKVVRKWGSIEMVRFGTILADNLLERFHFYPDRRSRGLKQIQRAIATSDQTVLDLESLKNKSVAIQGLGAAEFILFGTGSETLSENSDASAFRCGFGMAVSQNLARLASALDRGWNGDARFLELWRNPGPNNEHFGDGKQALAYLLSTLVHGLEEVRDVRLSTFLKATPDRDRPKSAPLWRSASSLPLLNADIRSLHQFYKIANIAGLIGQGGTQLNAKIEALFLGAINLSSATAPPAQLLADSEQRKQLLELRETLQQLTLVFYDEIAAPHGLTIGFFFADGD